MISATYHLYSKELLSLYLFFILIHWNVYCGKLSTGKLDLLFSWHLDECILRALLSGSFLSSVLSSFSQLVSTSTSPSIEMESYPCRLFSTNSTPALNFQMYPLKIDRPKSGKSCRIIAHKVKEFFVQTCSSKSLILYCKKMSLKTKFLSENQLKKVKM